MADSPGAVRAAVYIDSEEARRLAEQALGPLEQDAGGSFSGVAEGRLEPSEVKRLNEAGLVVEVLDDSEGEGEAAETPGSPAQALAESTELIEEIEQRSSAIELPEQSEEGPPENVYNIEIDGPITREQRLELDRLGVDIAAFEPGFGYRAFLTSEQLVAVRALRFVVGVARYDFARAVTPELLDLVEKDADAQAELMGGAEAGASEPQVFDCLVHREADLAETRELIDRSPDTTIVDTSNLRVRFSADLNVPFLSALAALPEVRQLSPFEAPTI